MHLNIINNLESILQSPVYLVGGAVRDILLGKPPKDWDFTTALTPDLVKKKLQEASKSTHTQGEKFGTIGTKIENGLFYNDNPKNPVFVDVEITTMRGEEYDQATKTTLLMSRKPSVNYITNLKEDLSRRDFTINAMAINSKGELLDYFDGYKDLDNELIKCVGSPKLRFKEDPLRILRAIRIATKYKFNIDQETLKYCGRMKFRLLDISKERWVMEIDKILSSCNVNFGLDLLMDTGLLGVIIPTLTLQKDYNQNSHYHDFTLWEHTKNVVANVPKECLSLRWTALLHDIAKPFTRTENKNGHSNYLSHELLGAEMAFQVCEYLKFSRARTNYIVEQIRTHLNSDSDLKIYDDSGKKLK